MYIHRVMHNTDGESVGKVGYQQVDITILTVGKLKEKYLRAGIDEYKKRLGAYVKIREVEVADEKAPEHLSASEMIQVKEKEGVRLLAKITPDAHVIALAIEGKMKTSEELADCISKLALHGKSKIVFLIGGSLGLSDDCLKRADEQLSFSKMTFPHQLMRLMLLEQVYRSFRIMRGEPYHK